MTKAPYDKGDAFVSKNALPALLFEVRCLRCFLVCGGTQTNACVHCDTLIAVIHCDTLIAIDLTP